MHLTEDELYRSSSQFRLWSFTPQQLATIRSDTNKATIARVRAAHQRHRAQRLKEKEIASATNTGSESEKTGSGVDNGVGEEKEVDCLTVAEEQKLLNTFCERAIDLGTFLKFPIEVVATGVQFLKRFYLYNSPMTYEPQAISRTAMYLAQKIENQRMTAEQYASNFPPPNNSVEALLAPEYLIVQALRFTFDIRHPFRALKGAHVEMLVMAQGKYEAPPSAVTPTTPRRTGQEIQADMLHLPTRPGGAPNRMTPNELRDRIEKSYVTASKILKTAAILSDAYFHYTPSQIMLASRYIADEPVTTFYITTKFPSSKGVSNPVLQKLLSTVRSCAKLLQSHRSLSSTSTTEDEKKAADEKAEVSALMRKLKHCRDPDKLDLVKLNQAQKRDAVKADGGLEESKAKRRKLVREEYKKEEESFWGPELSSVKEENGQNGAAK